MIGKAHKEFQKCVTYSKKSAVGAKLLATAQKKESVPVRKLFTEVKTRFTSKFKFYDDVVRNKPALRYMFGSSVAEKYMDRVPCADAWKTAETVADSLRYPATVCLKSQDRGHWLLGDAVHRIADLHIVFRDDCDAWVAEVERAEDKFLCLKYEMRKAVLGHMAPFLAPLTTFDKSKAHLFLSLAIHPQYKGLSDIVGLLKRDTTAVKSLREQYDREVLIPMCIAYKAWIAGPQGEAPPARSDAPEATETTPEPRKYADLDEDVVTHEATDPTAESVKAELLRFRQHKVEPDACFAPWWEKNEHMYTWLAPVARVLGGIPGSQIENERIFSIAGFVVGLRRTRLSAESLDLIVHIFKNFPDDPMEGLRVHLGDDLVAENGKESWKALVAKPHETLEAFEAELEEAGVLEYDAEEFDE
eukprot:gene6881-8215_t